jgi:hypothetical protein
MGSLAGHIIECGPQATGGIFTDWRAVADDWDDMGYPFVECSADGSFVVLKPPGTGGLVTIATVAEQITYEVHDPGRYLLPDVVCDFTNVRLEDLGRDQVRVTGARGLPAPEAYKASVTYPDGYRCTATLMIVGSEAVAKAHHVASAILKRTRRMCTERGFSDYGAVSVEVLGAESMYGPHARSAATREVILKLAVGHPDERALELFSREIFPSATSMAQGITGFAGGRPAVQPILRLTSCLVPKSRVHVEIEVEGERTAMWEHAAFESVGLPGAASPGAGSTSVESQVAGLPAESQLGELSGTRLRDRAPHGAVTPAAVPPGVLLFRSAPTQQIGGPSVEVPLLRLAHGRSGDKGDTANISVLARQPEFLPLLEQVLTAQAVRTYLGHLIEGEVDRFDWPGLGGWNFVLRRALGGGGTASLRYDPQGKSYAQILMDFPIRIPQAWLEAGGLLGGTV